MPEQKNGSLPLPPQVDSTLRRLRSAGYEAYIVGGCVRDFLRGVPPKDFDMTTSALPEQVHAVFAGERIIDTGIKHGTVTLLADGMPLEITTYRLDGEYRDARHPSAVSFTSSLREDVARRDFTMNAIAYHPEEGFCDFFGGRVDIAAGIIRAVGEPERRFREDALRILRALRFAAVLDFRIEEETARAARATAALLPRIAGERIREELFKLLTGVAAGRVLAENAEILAPLFPEWYAAVFENKGTRVSRIAELLPLLPADCVLRTVAFLLPLYEKDAKAADGLLQSLRLDRRTHRRILKLLSHLPTACTGEAPIIRRFLSGVGEEDAFALYAFHRATATLAGDGARLAVLAEAEAWCRALCEAGPVYSIADLAVRGEDLIALGFAEGRELGLALAALLDAVLDGLTENKRDALISYAKTYLR